MHFVLLGAVIVVIGRLLPGDTAPGTPGAARTTGAEQQTIRVSRGEIENLAALFAGTWGREPTDAEHDALVDRYVRDEALVRRALASGMAREDTVIRERLAQRMQFQSLVSNEEREPTEEELEAFRVSHPERFSSPMGVTFDHVFVDAKVWGKKTGERAERVLSMVRGLGEQADAEAYSDPFRRPHHYDEYAVDVVYRTYGATFGGAVETSPLGEWVGPIDSVYGVHLIRVTARSPGALLPLDTVREEAAAGWLAEQRAEAIRAFEDRLLAEYEIVIEPAATADDAEGGSR